MEQHHAVLRELGRQLWSGGDGAAPRAMLLAGPDGARFVVLPAATGRLLLKATAPWDMLLPPPPPPGGLEDHDAAAAAEVARLVRDELAATGAAKMDPFGDAPFGLWAETAEPAAPKRRGAAAKSDAGKGGKRRRAARPALAMRP